MVHGYALVMYNPNRFYEGEFHNNTKHGIGSNGVYIDNTSITSQNSGERSAGITTKSTRRIFLQE
jgi:hypothetical protein